MLAHLHEARRSIADHLASADPDRVTTAQAVEAMLDRWMAERAGVRAMVWVGHNRDQTLRVTRRTISLAAGRLDPELVDG